MKVNDQTHCTWLGPTALLVAAIAICTKPSLGDETDQQAIVLLQLISATGEPTHGTVYLGHIGFFDKIRELPSWSENRENVIPLHDLAPGTHTLVANPAGVNPTIFQIKLPAAKAVIQQRMDPKPKWRAGARDETLEARLTVEDRNEKAFLLLELTNKTDEAIRLPMLTMTNIEQRVLVPVKLQNGFTEIKAHTTKTMTLDWSRIVREGIWVPRHEPISEPWPADDPGEGREYFRLNVGTKGLLPVVVPSPSLIVQNKADDHEEQAPAKSDAEPHDSVRNDPSSGRNSPSDLFPDDRDWIDAEYNLQYRVRVAQQDRNGEPTNSAVPLIYLQIRNVGTTEFGIETHQSQHNLEVNRLQYRRDDQPWGGFARLAVNGPAITIPFLLSPDWTAKVRPGQATIAATIRKGNLLDREYRTKSEQLGVHHPSVVALQRKINAIDQLLNRLMERDSERRRDIADKRVALQLSKDIHSIVRLRLQLLELQMDEADQPQFKSTRYLSAQPIEIRFKPAEESELKAIAVENIHRELIVFPRFHSPKVTAHLQQLVLENQPESGDYLLTKLGEGNSDDHDPASFIIGQNWDAFTHAQIETYLQRSMSFITRYRKTYPHRIDASIGVGPNFRPGYGGLPRQEPRVTAKTTTAHFVDGEQVGEPFTYDSHSAISAWLPTDKLAVGPHTYNLTIQFEFKRRDQVYVGQVESPRYHFSIIDDTTDVLLAPANTKVDQHIQETIKILETSASSIRHGKRGWQPQIRWYESPTRKAGSLHMPIYEINEPLPLDLTFESQFHIEGTDHVIEGTGFVLLAGKTRTFYLMPRHIDKAARILRKHADENGFVKTRVVLKPSRRAALTNPSVKQYFGGTITSDIVRIRVDNDGNDDAQPPLIDDDKS